VRESSGIFRVPPVLPAFPQADKAFVQLPSLLATRDQLVPGESQTDPKLRFSPKPMKAKDFTHFKHEENLS
jgi:hypothetical protein